MTLHTKENEIYCPVFTMKGNVAFPSVQISIEPETDIGTDDYKRAFEEEKPILVLPEKIFSELGRQGVSFHNIGTLCRIRQCVESDKGAARFVLVGLRRAELVDIENPKTKNGALYAYCRTLDESCSRESFPKLHALNCEIKENLQKLSDIGIGISADTLKYLLGLPSTDEFSDVVASGVVESFTDKLRLLSIAEPCERALTVNVILSEMAEINELRKTIQSKVKERVNKNQSEYYLTEQLKVLRSQLGDDADGEDDIEEYKEKIKASAISEDGKKRLTKEADKLKRMPMNSAEYGVICNYLDVCLELPWGRKTTDRLDLDEAKNILDRDHDGLEKVKERILEFLAVRKLSPDLKNQILCLVGPPGTGKTSVARSIAESMKRKYVRVSLGGIRDEADIRGHRKTYIGSMPGRIIEGVRRAGSKNPVMLLDEIDKLTRDSHGDPASALMEVLDGEQNKDFRDHYVELPFDLSDVMFIATANTLDTIPAPLLDRMEVIELKSYSQNEKLAIAKHHLLPKQLKKHGLTAKQLKISKNTMTELINTYTNEAGVRNLEREIATLCRRAAKILVENEDMTAVSVTAKNLASIMGPKKVLPEKISADDEVGVVNGLAYTQSGGALLKVEAASMPGSGKLELTGSLGDVMKESAHAALTYIRSHSGEWNIPTEFYKEKDLHVHFPEGAVPKDGPSAGVTVVTAIVSELSGKPVRNDVAMTGEVTLRGNVLPIGGLKEKTMAAYKAGVKTVLIPKDNEKDLEELDVTVRENLKFIPCSKVSDVLKNALADRG